MTVSICARIGLSLTERCALCKAVFGRGVIRVRVSGRDEKTGPSQSWHNTCMSRTRLSSLVTALVFAAIVLFVLDRTRIVILS